MINIDFSKDGKIEFDLNISETNFAGTPEVKFGLKINGMDFLIPAIKLQEPHLFSGTYSVTFPSNDLIKIGDTYPCYVEVVMDTKRFVPFSDEVQFTNSDPKIEVVFKPVEPPQEVVAEPEVVVAQPVPEAVTEAVAPSTSVKKQASPKKPKVVKKQDLGAMDLLLDKESVQKEIKESQSFRKPSTPKKAPSKIIVDLPLVRKEQLSKTAQAAYANVVATQKTKGMVGEATNTKTSKTPLVEALSLFEDESKLLISLDNIKIRRAEVLTNS